MTAHSDDQPSAALRRYFDRTTVPLALSGTEGDVPLMLVNDGFCSLTGYDAEDVAGRNCRLLQGPETTPESKQQLHDFIHDDSVLSGRFEVLNYRKDGSTFVNLVFMTRLRDKTNATRFILASQFDMTRARRSHLQANDTELSRNMADMQATAHEFGLAMAGSAELISDSIATIARLSMDEED
ncbi:PAS domain-containing protein [Histidinibacterium aquaticum]|uniref:PAS domain-containing protein n=1 Tax=Histidinibacterium aquaticum TaxID=2613962 RepID=A0A5J5GQU1_9RHOB|nr:PAS domain-containing protein [Histidinibacterium aquaticum]KAA9009762.1 PAS domain-containing protein [Histidinibacterium aquaticum]